MYSNFYMFLSSLVVTTKKVNLCLVPKDFIQSMVKCPVNHAHLHSCPTANMSIPIPCQAGYYANETGSTECTICPLGSYCPDPAGPPATCPDGKYSPGTCSNCIDCAAGFRYDMMER